MNAFFTLSYQVGFHPWEDLAEHEPYAGALLGLVEREERGKTPPYGRALDLGCGSAVWGVRFARRGWEVTGVDNVAKALKRAEERIKECGVEIRLVQGDVTRLRESEVGSDYALIVDTGTFHSFNRRERLAMGREVDAVAGQEAVIVLDCFSPGKRGPLPHGCTRADVEEAFPAWRITDVVDADTEPDALARALKFNEVFYRLERR